MNNVLLLGGDTSLGKVFAAEVIKRGHNVVPIHDESTKRHSNMLMHDIPTRHYDWVVNCYGKNYLQRIGEMEWFDESKRAANSLLVDNVAPILWVVNELVRRGHPGVRVLSIASQTYRVPQTNTALYCASKAALVMLTKVMARELAERCWVINCLAPGKIEDTRMARMTDQQVVHLRDWAPEKAEEYALRNIPMRRFTTCDEVVAAMFAILEHMPDYVNGTCIDMTGGA